MIIYKATNIQNNKVYIGQTVGLLKTRINGHISESKRNVKNNKFHNAISKYGADSFRWEIIDKANSKDELNKLEIFYINLYNSTKDEYGYNTQLGGNLSSSKKVINLTNGDVYMSAAEAERILKKLMIRFQYIISVQYVEEINFTIMGLFLNMNKILKM